MCLQALEVVYSDPSLRQKMMNELSGKDLDCSAEELKAAFFELWLINPAALKKVSAGVKWTIKTPPQCTFTLFSTALRDILNKAALGDAPKNRKGKKQKVSDGAAVIGSWVSTMPMMSH